MMASLFFEGVGSAGLENCPVEDGSVYEIVPAAVLVVFVAVVPFSWKIPGLTVGKAELLVLDDEEDDELEVDEVVGLMDELVDVVDGGGGGDDDDDDDEEEEDEDDFEVEPVEPSRLKAMI